MSKKIVSLFVLTALFCGSVFFLISKPVMAQTIFDGAYDYSYTVYWGSTPTTYDLSTCFIVSNGQISYSGSHASFYFSGSVDDNGIVNFQAPDPNGGPLAATFTGTIQTDGTGGGSWSDPASTGGGHGEWYVTLVSGGSLGDTGDTSGSSSFFSDIGEAFGATGANAATIGALALVGCVAFPIAMVLGMRMIGRRMKSHRDAGSAKKGSRLPNSRPIGYSVSPATPTESTTFGPTGGQIESGGLNLGGPGASVGSISLGPLPFLNGIWTPGQVSLAWGTPQYDQSKYVLDGYNVYQQTYGPTSNVATSILLNRAGPLPPNVTATNQPFNQTYRFNTGGDIAGYRVEPVFHQITPQGPSPTFPHGGLGIRPGEYTGTFGVGP